jgi:hypothetical protein
MDLENTNIPHIYGCRNSCMLGISLNLDFNMLSNFRYYEKNAMLLDFHLHLHTDLMLRYCIRSSLALAYGNIRSSIAFAH